MSWHRRKYHLNVLLLLLPLVFMGQYFAGLEGGPHEGAIRLSAQPVGDWRVRAYMDHFEPGGLLDVHARFSEGAYRDVRAAFLAIDDAPPERDRLLDITYSAALHCGEYHLEAHVPVPERLSRKPSLWLTVEAWDGAIYRTSWPLRQIGETGKGVE